MIDTKEAQDQCEKDLHTFQLLAVAAMKKSCILYIFIRLF